MSTLSPELNWKRLFRIACRHICQVNSRQQLIEHWTLGGGTALMLQINHRESHDVDIFIPDPQLLAFLDPEKQDFQFEIQPDGCIGDGARSLRLAFENTGQIDFIVAAMLTSSPAKPTAIEGETVLLETIPEIITKKIFYRGENMTPRDVFDIAAAGERYLDSIIPELRQYREQVIRALRTIDRIHVDFMNRAIAELAIKEPYKEIAKAAIQKSKGILRAV